MKHAFYTLVFTLTACGSAGELGVAKFNVEGDVHQSHVAVGSQFSVSAKISTFGEKLSVRSDNSGFIQSAGELFEVVDAGEFRIEAWDKQNDLVDWLYFSSVAPDDIVLRSGTAHHFTWSNDTENSFAMLEGDYIELAMDVVDQEGNPLLHTNLVNLEVPASWQLQASVDNDEVSLRAGQSGPSSFTINAGDGVSSQFFVDVVEPWELQSLHISSTPPMSSPTFDATSNSTNIVNGSWFLVSAFAETWDGKAVLLSHEHFSIQTEFGAEEVITGAGGMWVRVPYGQPTQVNVSAGPLTSSYLIGQM